MPEIRYTFIAFLNRYKRPISILVHVWIHVYTKKDELVLSVEHFA